GLLASDSEADLALRDPEDVIARYLSELAAPEQALEGGPRLHGESEKRAGGRIEANLLDRADNITVAVLDGVALLDRRPIPFLHGRGLVDRPQVGIGGKLVSGRGRPTRLRSNVVALLEGRLRLELLFRQAESDFLALCVRGLARVLADDDLTAAQRLIDGHVAAEVGQSALDRSWLRRARRRRGARLRAAARSARTARPARSRSWTSPRWRLLSGRRRLPLRVPGLRANELEDLVDQFDVEFRVAVGRIESQRLDVGRARVEDPAQTEE